MKAQQTLNLLYIVSLSVMIQPVTSFMQHYWQFLKFFSWGSCYGPVAPWFLHCTGTIRWFNTCPGPEFLLDPPLSPEPLKLSFSWSALLSPFTQFLPFVNPLELSYIIQAGLWCIWLQYPLFFSPLFVPFFLWAKTLGHPVTWKGIHIYPKPLTKDRNENSWPDLHVYSVILKELWA